ncbi:hypothetical protein IMSAGC018_01975 [Lachnospiraceae bacterium]|nr:hypothetical protein IMSAGC018_01975 [Lachnospiraceae bacterium]
MGRGGKYHAEGGLSSGNGEGPCGGVKGKIPVWRGSSAPGSGHLHGRRGAGDSYVRSVWRLLHVGRSPCPCIYECGGRIWGLYACGYFQSFWECGEGVPFSTRICESKTFVCPVDGHRKRRVSGRDETESCQDYRCDGGKDCGLWA